MEDGGEKRKMSHSGGGQSMEWRIAKQTQRQCHNTIDDHVQVSGFRIDYYMGCMVNM